MNSEIENTEVKQEVKSLAHRNAYQVKPEMEYNLGKSPRQPTGLKIYAELTRRSKRKSHWIKSQWVNKLYSYVVDVCLFGEMEYSKPGHNAIIYGITDY